MKQISQTIIIFFLTLLLASLAPAELLPDSDCQGSAAAVNTSACCKAAAAMTEPSGCSNAMAVDHDCPQGGWCQVDAHPETYWRASGGLQHVDYAVQNQATIAQPVTVLPARTVVPGPSPPLRGSTPRYILICSFLI